MRGLWQRLIISLTPGVRLLLLVWTVLFLTSLVLVLLSVTDIRRWFMLTGPNFRHGQVWRLASYAFLPVNMIDFVQSGLVLICCGGMLERVWLRRDLFLYCFVATMGGGLAKIALQPSSPVPLLGPGPIAYALMAAVGWLFAHEKLLLPPSFQVSVREAMIVFIAISVICTIFSCGWFNAVAGVFGAGSGLLYLWLRSEFGRPRTARSVVSQRINRLEL